MTSSRLMVAFAGTELPAAARDLLRRVPVAGVTLFRHRNVASAAQVRALTASIQDAATASGRPLLIATDQEGGQLIGLGDDTTQFAGAMALGAAGDARLAERVGRAIGLEMRALGLNVNYAPVCDLATNSANPTLGIRGFGDDPSAVGEMAAATVSGLQSAGVAATLKHFPGTGDVAVDAHHALPVVAHPRELLEQRELAPFRAAIAARARLIMAGHGAVPAFGGAPAIPASLSREIVTDLLRDQLGFDGLSITDALDMHALAQGDAQVGNTIAAIAAGEDLLLGTPDPELIARMEAGLADAEQSRTLDPAAREESERRLATLREWLSGFDQPDLSVVGSSEHQRLAAELARRSITLIRDDPGYLPLRVSDEDRIAVIQPLPTDMTPADTSSYVPPMLASAIRTKHAATDEFIVEPSPSRGDAGQMLRRLAGYDLVVLGTVATNLLPDQAEFARAVLALDRPTVTVALRTPWDLPTYAEAEVHVCTYGILEPSLSALADALFGDADFHGRLPVPVGTLYPRGHGLARAGEAVAAAARVH